MTFDLIEFGSAIFSDCGTYRYQLTRGPREAAAAVFVMLNPSTADANQNDPTIRRCLGFARAWGFGQLIVANLYALRSTDPRALKSHLDPVGPENDLHLRQLAATASSIVVAWGANAEQGRAFKVATMMRAAGARLSCLGTTRDGAPRHPLYVSASTPLQEYRP